MNREVRDILLRVVGNSQDAERKLLRIGRRLADLDRRKANPQVDVQGILKAIADVNAARAALEALDGSDISVEMQVEVDRALARIAAVQSKLEGVRDTKVGERDMNEVRRVMEQTARTIGDVGSLVGRAAAPVNELNQQFAGMLGMVKQVNPVVQGLSIIITAALIPAFIALGATIIGAIVGAGSILIGFMALLGPLILGVVAIAQRIGAVMQARQARQAAMNAETRRSAVADEQAKQRAEALRAAHQSVRDAAEQRVTAARNLRNAEVQAQQQIAQAQTDAIDAARNLERETVGAYNAMRDAVLGVVDAQLGLESANLSVEEAKLQTREANRELKDYAKQAGLTGDAFGEMFQKFTDIDFNPKGIRDIISQSRAAGQMGGDPAAADEFQSKVLAVARARLNEREATQRVKHATNDLTDARKTEQDFIKRGIAAYEPYTQAIDANAKAQRELAEVLQAGVSGNPAVVAARESLRDANQRAAEAQHNLRRELTKTGTEASLAATGPMALYEKQLSKLSDAERKFMDATIGLGKEFRKLGQRGTDAFLTGLTEGIEALTATAGPGIERTIAGIGDALGDAARDLGADLATPEWQSAMEAFGRAAASVARTLAGPAFRDFLAIMRNVALAILPRLLNGVGLVADKLAEWRRGTSNVGELRDRLNPFVDMLKSALRFIGAVIGALMALGGAAGGNGLLDWLTTVVEKFTAWLNSAEGQNTIKSFFEDTLPAVKSVIQFVMLLVTAFLTGFQVIAPAVKFVVDGFNLLLKVIIWLMRQLLRIPAPIRALLGLFFPWGGILKGIIGLVARIGPMFGRAAGAIRGFMAPVINWLRGAFNGVWRTISSIAGRVGSLFDDIMGIFRAGVNLLIGALNWVIRGVNKINVKIPDWVPEALGGGKRFGFNIPEIPTLASGGMVTSDTLARIGEAGREAVLPLRGAVLRQIGTAIAAAMPGGTRAGGARAGGAGAGRGGIHVERVVLPPPPQGGVPDPRYAAVQFANELARRGGVPA